MSRGIHLPRIALLLVWAGLTALAYYLILFTNWGSVYRGGTYLGVVLTDVVSVLAILSSMEVLRTERVVAFRALAGAVGAPLVLVTLLLLWYGVRRYLAA